MKNLTFSAILLWSITGMAAKPGPGDAKITELMANSALGTDWVEIKNTGKHEINLGGCRLRVGLGKVREKVLPDLPMAPGRHVVIAGAPFPPECDYHADITWSGVRLCSSKPDAVELWCPKGKQGITIDRVLFNLRMAKLQKGYSIVYCQDNQSDVPGLMQGWRPTQATAFCSILGTADHGDPGLPDKCVENEQKSGIRPGDIEITEIMVHPVPGTPEWVELTNITQQKQSLDGCVLKTDNSDGPGMGMKGLFIPPVSSLVLANRPGVTGTPGKEIVLKGLKLVDSQPRDIVLVCQGKEICRVGYDPNHGDVQQGRSICFEYSTDPSNPSQKYLASDITPYANSPRGVNYGTPFDPAPCDKEEVIQDPSASSGGCTQGYGPGSPGAGWLFFFGVTSLLVFRLKRNKMSG